MTLPDQSRRRSTAVFTPPCSPASPVRSPRQRPWFCPKIALHTARSITSKNPLPLISSQLTKSSRRLGRSAAFSTAFPVQRPNEGLGFGRFVELHATLQGDRLVDRHCLFVDRDFACEHVGVEAKSHASSEPRTLLESCEVTRSVLSRTPPPRRSGPHSQPRSHDATPSESPDVSPRHEPRPLSTRATARSLPQQSRRLARPASGNPRRAHPSALASRTTPPPPHRPAATIRPRRRPPHTTTHPDRPELTKPPTPAAAPQPREPPTSDSAIWDTYSPAAVNLSITSCPESST
jgi:hypothetical protein